jgi:hypothetical protein
LPLRSFMTYSVLERRVAITCMLQFNIACMHALCLGVTFAHAVKLSL